MTGFVNSDRAFGSSKRENGFSQPVTARFSGFSVKDDRPVDHSENTRIRQDHAAKQDHGADVCGPQPTT